ncbi:MAG: hypothetical protein KatS3mg088_478 [Patescibacteria group bacterium]|nr:MAG: hypothetical protein KatS3mg088_478 [Patescibacteria group bacterium]
MLEKSEYTKINKRDGILLIGILAFQLFFLFNLKFTAWPEMLAWPYLMIKGWMPYRDIAIAHNPLLLVDLAIFYKFFGVGVWQLKFFTWLLIILSEMVLFLIAKEIWGRKVALWSVLFYSFWVIFYEGNGIWFDFYMGILAFISFYLVYKKDWFLAGVFWSLAFLSKQTAIWFLFPILFEIIVRPPLKIESLKMVFGAGAVLSIFLFLLWKLGILFYWWNWAVNFGVFVLPKSTGQIKLPGFSELFVSLFPFFVFLLLFLNHKSKLLNLFLWSLAGILGAYPRFEYFHFQPAIFYLSIAAALVFSDFKKISKIGQMFLIFFVLGNTFLFARFLERNFNKETRFYESDFRKVIDYVREETKPGDYIFVLNWWDSLYALTETIPATKPLVPQLAWYQEFDKIQKKEVEDIASIRPKLVVLNSYTDSGLSSYIPKELYNYIDKNYIMVDEIGDVKILNLR